MTPPLACTVRDCGLLLQREARVYRCARGHSYDVARIGYVNLLQPQDRRSPAAGDTAAAVAARARLLAAGIGRRVVDAIATRMRQHLDRSAIAADLGAGSGELLGAVHEATTCLGIGIDLSTAAADRAARTFPQLTWVVANADRGLPLLDRSVDAVLSLHGRRNPQECARVLVKGGVLVVAVPAPDDLRELRAEVLGEASERRRIDAVIDDHAGAFAPIERFTVTEARELDPDQLRDVLRGTYRGARASAAQRITALSRLHVTFSSEVVVLRGR